MTRTIIPASSKRTSIYDAKKKALIVIYTLVQKGIQDREDDVLPELTLPKSELREADEKNDQEDIFYFSWQTKVINFDSGIIFNTFKIKTLDP